MSQATSLTRKVPKNSQENVDRQVQSTAFLGKHTKRWENDRTKQFTAFSARRWHTFVKRKINNGVEESNLKIVCRRHQWNVRERAPKGVKGCLYLHRAMGKSLFGFVVATVHSDSSVVVYFQYTVKVNLVGKKFRSYLFLNTKLYRVLTSTCPAKKGAPNATQSFAACERVNNIGNSSDWTCAYTLSAPPGALAVSGATQTMNAAWIIPETNACAFKFG